MEKLKIKKYLKIIFFLQLTEPTTASSQTTQAAPTKLSIQTPSPNGILRPYNVDLDEQRLTRDLFKDYDSGLRPVLRQKDNVTVILGISIHQIIDVVRNVLQHFGNLAF
jgi:hypothetical protein